MTPIQQIKEKLDIVEFIRSYIPLHPAGKNFKACCPFHKEKTPSFIVSPERQTWHCFGSCSEGGDIFKFIMKHDNLEFYEALKFLAEKTGIELKKFSPADQKQFGILYDINNSAKDFFKKQLANSEEAKKYLASRGLKKETIEEFELGFVSSGFDGLMKDLIKLGYDVRDAERAGLVFKSERGGYIDRFRNRIMFPICNGFGKVVGFSGRILPQYDKGEVGKYINSPETPIFNKSKTLYGFHKSKNFIREEKTAVLVEGQMDFLMAWQDGLKNVVATSGTAFTQDHLVVLKRQANNLVFCFDNDEAGFKAMERGIDMAQTADFSVKVLTLKDYKDPGEAVQKSPGLMVKLAKEAEPAMEFYFGRYLQNADKHGLHPAVSGANADLRGNIGDFKQNIRIILEKIRNLASPIERDHWLHQLSLKTKIKEETLLGEMNQMKTAAVSRAFAAEKQFLNSRFLSSFSRLDLIIQKLFGLAAIKEEFQIKIGEYLDYFPENYLALAKNISQKTEIKDENSAELMNLISLKSSFESHNFDGDKMHFEFQELVQQLRLEHLKKKRQDLVLLIKEAEISGDEKRIAAVLKEFDEISKLMHY